MLHSGGNRKLLKRTLIAAALIFSGFIGGTIFGFGFAGSLMFFSHSVPSGLLAAKRLNQIEENELRGVKLDLESDVDNALATYSYASEKWWFPLYERGWLILIVPDNFERYVGKAATYRKTHPTPLRNVYKDISDPDKRDFLQRLDEAAIKYAEQ